MSTREQKQAIDRNPANKCKANCGNTAKLGEDYCGLHMPKIFHYETEAMSQLRAILYPDFTHEEIDIFKAALSHLEARDFKLTREEHIDPSQFTDWVDMDKA